MIAVDCEGAACVVGGPGQSLSNSCNMAFAKEQVTRETNAAVRALFDSGAKNVVVWDSHGDGVNLIYDQLDQRCEIVLGSGFSRRFPELNNTYAGVLMIGYHAMAGTDHGVLAHTYSSGAYRAILVNGVDVGEIALDAAVAGELGVPLICIVSDQLGCDEALQNMPWVETVVTKQGLGRHCAKSKHPAVVEKEIEQAVERAVTCLADKKPFSFAAPVEMELHFATLLHWGKAKVRRCGWQMSGIKRLRKTLLSMLEWQC